MMKWPDLAQKYLVSLAGALGIQIEQVEKIVIDKYSKDSNQEKVITTNSLTKEMAEYEELGGVLFDQSEF